MKRCLIFLGVSLLFLFSCSEQNSQEKIKQKIFKQWLGKNLIIPEDIIGNHTVASIIDKERDTLSFVHYFNGACAACLGHLKSIDGFINTLKNNHVKLYLIAYSNTPQKTKKVFDDAKLKYTVYIDSLNSLYFKNRFNSVHLESFLLDKQKKILCVGELKDKKFRRKVQKLISTQNE